MLGVVVTWTGLPDDEVINQYNPFTTGYPAASGLPGPGDPGCPAVWVGDSTGTELSMLAASGQASATLVLTADITVGAATETVWGWLKGAGNTGKNIIINGSYGAGLARHITTAGVRVVEVDRSDRQDRRRQGKSDPLDAVSAARAAQSGRARGASKGRDGAVEAIRALMVAKRSAAGERTQTINQARALILTGPEDLRARFTGHTVADLVAGLASLRPRPGSTVGYATRIALRELGRRAEFPGAQIERLDELIVPLVRAHAPALLALFGIGPNTAALLLIAAGDHPERLRSEAAWVHLCAAAPIPASSGKTTRHRLNRGGDRQANHALWRIVFTRMGSHPATRAYVERRTAEGKSKKENHPLPETLRRPRGLPPPARFRRLTHTPGGGLAQYSAAATAGLRTIRRPSPGHHKTC